MKHRLIRAAEWAVLLPVWREATETEWLRAVAAGGVGLIWLIVTFVGIVAALGGGSGNGNQQFGAAVTKSPTASATPKPTPATPGPAATVTPEATPPPAPPAPAPPAELAIEAATPTPAPAALPSAAVLVGAGDIASCSSSGDEATAALLDNIPGTVFTAGDNVYESGSPAEYANCYDPSWGRFKARTKPVPGNHEYLTAGAGGYFGYFSGIPPYYAYDLGGWRVYALNSSNVDKAAELAWLQADLAANPRLCVVAYWHHPVFTNGPHADDEGKMRAIWDSLAANNADLIINGHDHHYQRFAPISGMREIVVGTGGKNITTPDRKPAALEVDNHDTFGVLQLTLHATSFDWQFVPVAGKTFTDSGSQSCH